MKPTNIVVLYHDNCNDGFGAAFAHWYLHKDNRDRLPTEYQPINYGDELPDCINAESHVIFLDFSIPRDAMAELLARVAQVTLIDHHKTSLAVVNLEEDFTNFKVVHNLAHSGAVLTWLVYAESDQAVPDLLLDIEDRDLWLFNRQWSKYTHAALANYPKDFFAWEELLYSLPLTELRDKGEAMISMRDAIINSSLPNVSVLEIKGVTFLTINTLPTLSSDTAEAIRERYPLSEGQCCYSIVGNYVMYSLRSQDKTDVAWIAEQFGGGGHANAAGFKLPIQESHLIKELK